MRARRRLPPAVPSLTPAAAFFAELTMFNNARILSHYLASTSVAVPPSVDQQLSSALAPALAMGPLPASLPLLQDALVAQQGQEMELLLHQAQEAYRIGDYQRALTLCQTVSHPPSARAAGIASSRGVGCHPDCVRGCSTSQPPGGVAVGRAPA